MVIKFCDKYLGEGGAEQELTDEIKEQAAEVQKSYAKRCLRTLLIARVDYPIDEWNALAAENNNFKSAEDQEKVEAGLTMVGIFGLKDPLRPGIFDSVKTCHKAGINVRMVTGDNIDTAKAISLEAGIITAEDLVDEEDSYVAMEGKTFREAVVGKVETIDEWEEVENEETGEMEQKKKSKVVCNIGNMFKFKEIEKQLKVMARSQPDDKFMLVDGLIKLGRTVAVTGDGTNDAPALNRSDVGFAMGISGTDVAKNACDIQLTTDDFCTILVAVEYGRNIYDNVRKFLQFQLTVNVVAMFIVFAGACITGEPPLTPTQMLWVNLIMDTFAALALATEPPNKKLLDRDPALKSDAIVNSVMWRNIIGQSIFQIIVLLVLLLKGGDIFGLGEIDHTQDYYVEGPDGKLNIPTTKGQMYTIIFQAFVFMQLFNQINARKLGEKEFNVFSEFCNNFMFIAIVIATFGIQMLIVEYGGAYMNAVPLTWEQNGYCAAIGAFSLIVGVLLKFVPARWFEWIRLEEREMTPEEEQSSMKAWLKKSSTLNMSKARSSTRNSKRKQVTFQDNDNDYKIN